MHADPTGVLSGGDYRLDDGRQRWCSTGGRSTTPLSRNSVLAPSARTFDVVSSITPESLTGFLNPAECFRGEGTGCFPPFSDPVVDMSNGDPNPTQIMFTNGVHFNITITPASTFFDLIRTDNGPLIQSFDLDLTSGFDSSLNGMIFSCGGNAFNACGFHLDDLTIRFSGSTIPEPASVWLLLTAAGVVGWRKRPSRS